MRINYKTCNYTIICDVEGSPGLWYPVYKITKSNCPDITRIQPCLSSIQFASNRVVQELAEREALILICLFRKNYGKIALSLLSFTNATTGIVTYVTYILTPENYHLQLWSTTGAMVLKPRLHPRQPESAALIKSECGCVDTQRISQIVTPPAPQGPGQDVTKPKSIHSSQVSPAYIEPFLTPQDCY